MGFQSVLRWGVDLTLVAMLLAAVRRETGLVFAYERYDFTKLIRGYLTWGEYCFQRFINHVKGDSGRFRKQLDGVDKFLGEP
ncbi:similar to Saccharomyces cerevisiae YKL018C-A Putative protein of unknown function [Maudiozyma barnettii]|uniref:Uncharacterized protein n=1 Tax=Maudiozyma barnettii TaxID=61262 RepID=A0A8H2VJ95_9SACH|nr:Mco12p [Kazachstania barnettii]CAB4256467.1 similar to Saccharomyces cerevisiae YKL018C-A Putative protein of unknown function [Kazachstania barnettii]CAD1785076.1 similar to Saccharomyces cerevisiae YKL018C-A Putative protein of unknown function [Kazachstania barnettii]